MQKMETRIGVEATGSNSYRELSEYSTQQRFSSFYAQTKLLLVKNNLILRRNLSSTLMQTVIGMFFMIMLCVINSGLESDQREQRIFSSTKDMPTTGIPPLHRCTPGRTACHTFAYAYKSGMKDADVHNIVKAIGQRAVPPLPLEGKPYGPIGFSTPESMYTWIYKNPNTTNIAVEFTNVELWDMPGADISYTLSFNRTKSCYNFGLTCTDPVLSLGSSMQVAIDNALLKSKYGLAKEDATVAVALKPFPHPDLPFSNDAMKNYGSMFIFVTLMFNFIIQLSHVVKEKELRLREAMKQMGLRTAPYWVSWFVTNAMLDLICVLILCVTGAALQLDFFLKNSFFLYFILLLLMSLALTMAAFFFATFLNRAEQARNLGFALFVLFFIAGNGLVGYYFSSDTFAVVQWWLSWILPIPFLEGVSVLIDKSSGSAAIGLSWSDRSDVPAYYSLSEIYNWEIVNFFLYLMLTWYCDQVIPGEFGVSRPWYFPLTRSYWFGNGHQTRVRSKSQNQRPHRDYPLSDDPNVRAEEKLVRSGMYGDRNVKVIVDRLRKDFTSRSLCRKNSTFTAVEGVSYAIDSGQLLCMLGHNGAGKTTTINMLTGMLPISDGDAFIFGHSAKHDMNSIREIMGICPQHDVLWDQLTGIEHLRLFAGLKGMSASEIEAEAWKRLEQVQLTAVAHVQAQAYSGGMKRRLSLAVALIGDPQIVFLDEPTTGMDPVTRRTVWNMILKAKRDRIILLTTHSMEEADVLADRICIMSKGKIQALGTSLHLKQQFGTGYRLTILCEDGDFPKEKIKKFVSANISRCKLEVGVPGLLEYNIPRSCIAEMPQILSELKRCSADLQIKDVSVSLATLEEVFLNLSKAELQHLEEIDLNTTVKMEVPLDPSKGYTPGMVLEVRDQWQRSHHVTVTEEGLSAGTEFIDIEKPDERDPPSVSTEIMGLLPFEKTEVVQTFWSQVSALGVKTWRYQRRQSGQTFCIIVFPIVSIILLLVLNFAISANEAANSYNMKCANNKTLKSFFDQSASDPSLVVGSPSLLNPGAFLDPLKEIPDYSIPFSKNKVCAHSVQRCNVGRLKTSIPTQLKQWYSKVIGRVVNLQTCQLTFSSYLSKHQSVNNALQWESEYGRQSNTTQGYTPTSGGPVSLQDCKVKDEPKEDGKESKNGLSWKPKASAFAALASQQAELISCQTGNISVVLDLYTKLKHIEPQSLPQKGAQHKFTLHDGVLGNFSTGYVPDPTFATFENFVFISLNALLSKVTVVKLNDIGGVCNLFSGPGGDDIMKLVQKALESGTSPPLFKKLGEALPYVCWVRESRDTIRSLSFEELPSVASVNSLLYKGWFGVRFGNVVNTAKVAAYTFNEVDHSRGKFDYVAWYNATGSSAYLSFKGSKNWQSLVNLMNSAFMKSSSQERHGIKMSVMPWPSPPTKASLNPLSVFSVVDLVAGIFFPFVLFALMPIVMSLIMYEKENRLREIMKMMGLKMGAYWIVTYFLFLLEYLVMVSVFWIAGTFGNIHFFTLHDPIILFLYLFIWGNALIAFSLFLTAFFENTRTAVAVGFVSIFAFVLFGYMVFETLQSQGSDVSELSYMAWQWLPPFAFMRIMVFLVNASSKGYAVTFDNWDKTPIPSTLGWLVLEWMICLLLLYYFEQVLSVGYGVRRHPLFCCFRKFWCPGHTESSENKYSPKTSLLKGSNELSNPNDDDYPSPEDVLAETERVAGDGHLETNEPNPFRLRILGLRKKYPGRGGASAKIAVDNLFLGVNKNECFGLLGPNGAGKTTSISMMCGLFEPTAGDALAMTDGGKALRISMAEDLNHMHAMMGVCPQHDVLWNDLTAREHVTFYGRLKGLHGTALKQAVVKVLDDVKLLRVADKQSGKFSGGMKRRLSVAISLIGSPRLVYLDEPSTGLDPSARRTLWDVITAAKGDGKAIVLTTHSMEEADALCDRIGIMALGKLRCIGISADLKRRYGAGFALSIATSGGAHAERKIENFVRKSFPSSKFMVEAINGSYTFEIPRTDVDLARVFRDLESSREDLEIDDWGITETTLEEVFLKATRGPDGRSLH